MIMKVIGKAGDFELVFEDAGDCWTAVTPANIYGEYPVELWVHDAAGNVSYMATMLYIISKQTLKAYLIPLEYQGVLGTDELSGMLDTMDFEAVLDVLKILSVKVKGDEIYGNNAKM